jgi:hypothetical protein
MEYKDAPKWWGLYINSGLAGVLISKSRPSIEQFKVSESYILNSFTVVVLEVKIEKK